MNDPLNAPHALFEGHQLLARGPLQQVVAEAVARVGVGADGRPLLLLNDGSGETVDLDLRGGLAQVLERLQARLAPALAAPQEAAAPRERGRPRLGVVAREVTLLPRHWEWLASQRGGASQALRRLVDEARRREQEQGLPASPEARYKAMSTLAGDMPGFEEASRLLFAGDEAGFARSIAQWPQDLRDYLGSVSAEAED
ncbi:DUF2239 family protein [Stenotrophomonas sp. ATCM1_4]|uniref:DUF2239 family protein n=1 Tax=Stenotrophomonas sp. ATCM1_4 TaxID=2259330 RepID=UPI00104D4625|nr:DUF2239 family protein [Stenotrophomonas sp. ATCM1_4]TDB28237.1 DUF2239 family protein [Stenotrophomonas sp. ATCM1_4]